MADNKVMRERIDKMQAEVIALFNKINATPIEMARVCRRIVQIQLDLKKK